RANHKTGEPGADRDERALARPRRPSEPARVPSRGEPQRGEPGPVPAKGVGMSFLPARRRARNTAAAAAAAVVLAGCSLTGAGDDERAEVAEGASVEGTTVVLATHSSFSLPEELVEQFEADTGVTLQVRSSADAGELTTQLVLNKENPFADVAFGVDNTFATRAVAEGVFAEYAADLPEGAERLRLDG